MHLARYLLVLLVAAVFASPAAAQPTTTEPAFVPGQRARVTYQRLRRPLIGEFVSFDEHALVIRKAGEVQPYYITWDKIARLEESVDQYTRRETAVRGVTTGFLVGIAIGTSVIALNEVVGSNVSWSREHAVEAAIEGLVISTVAGGLLAITWPKDTWRRVPLHGDPPRLTMRPLRGGHVGLGLSLGD
jgi:hypothetical protein